MQVGFEIVPGDTNSAELPLQVLALIGTAGFALEPIEGWQPQMAALKGGGVWAESSTSTGRTLIAGEDGNVTETMRLTIGTGDPKLLSQYIVRLNRFIELARQHWTTFFQTLPVYIKWKAKGAPDFQYALVYNIDAAVEFNPDGDPGLANATLSVEREPYWRAFAPGKNPRAWYARTHNLPFNTDRDSLVAGVQHFAYDVISNKFEWTPTALGLQTTPLSKNYIEIDGSLIPGDAPALVEMQLEQGAIGGGIKRLHVAKSTKPTRSVDNTGVTRANAYILAAGDGAVLTGGGGSKSVAGNAEDSVISNGSSVQDYYYTRSILNTETAYFDVIKWGANATLGGLAGELVQLDRNLLSGKFAVFVRGYVTAGVAGNLQLRVTFKEDEDGSSANVYSPIVVGTDIDVQPAPFSNAGVLHYIGDVSIPFSTKRAATLDGYGRLIRQTRDNFSVTIAVKNAIGTTRTLVITDLIMMPMDDAYLIAQTADSVGSSSLQKAVLDNTGYLNLGNPGMVGVTYVDWTDTGGVSLEVRGQGITLTPGITQRLYFLVEGLNGSSYYCVADAVLTVRLNIIPRWRGIRDI